MQRQLKSFPWYNNISDRKNRKLAHPMHTALNPDGRAAVDLVFLEVRGLDLDPIDPDLVAVRFVPSKGCLSRWGCTALAGGLWCCCDMEVVVGRQQTSWRTSSACFGDGRSASSSRIYRVGEGHRCQQQARSQD